jgi:hypothetical protein
MRRGSAKKRHRDSPNAAAAVAPVPRARGLRWSRTFNWALDLRRPKHHVATETLVEVGDNVFDEEGNINVHDDQAHGVLDDEDSDHDAQAHCPAADGAGRGLPQQVLDSPQGMAALKQMRIEASVLIEEWRGRGKVHPYSCTI